MLSASKMAGHTSIKLFQFNRKYNQAVGIYWPTIQSNQMARQCSINSKNLLYIICLTEFLVSSIAFILFEAKSKLEFSMTTFSIHTITTVLVMYLLTVWQIGNILKLTDNCEKFIEKSK